MREPGEWEVIEYVREALADIRARLKAGAEGAGVTLDADDCVKVLACLVDPSMPNHTPIDHTLRDAAIFIDFCLRHRGMPRAQAVAETATLFGESKWTVNDVLRRRALEK